MKTKILENLLKRVLLVGELPEDETKVFFDENHNVIVSDFQFDGMDGNWKLLGKLKDLTDEQCEGLVESLHGMYKNYSGGKKGLYRSSFYNAKESFLSALEAENLHMNGNPISEKLGFIGNVGEAEKLIALQKQKRRWQEAEQNAFSPETLIFVEQ